MPVRPYLTRLAGVGMMLAAGLLVAPAPASAADPVDPNWILAVDFDPDTVGSASTADPTAIGYTIQVATTCADFDFAAECDAYTFRGNYLTLLSPSCDAVAQSGFTLNSAGVGTGVVTLPADAEPGHWQAALTVFRGADYGDTPTFGNIVCDGTPGDTVPLPEGVEDGVDVLGACGGCPSGAAPVAAADSFVTDQDTALVVEAPGVLGNDTDADGDLAAAVLVSGPENGSLSLEPDGSFVYTPAPGFAGLDSFSYAAEDLAGLRSEPAEVSLEVLAAADPRGPKDVICETLAGLPVPAFVLQRLGC